MALPAKVTVLIIADAFPKDAKNLADQLRKLSNISVECSQSANLSLATSALLNQPADVIFIDASIITSSSSALIAIREVAPNASIVATLKKDDEPKNIELLRTGVDDCFVKDSGSRQLTIAMYRACNLSMLRRERSMAKDAAERAGQLHVSEEKLLLKEELLESRKLEAIGQLAGGVAHDFNNILGAISGYAEMIQKHYGAHDAKLDKYSSTILSGAKRAAELTAQLLTFARKGSYRMERCDIHELLNRTIQLLPRSFDGAIKIRKDLRAAQFGILGDTTQLQTAFLNIAMNALDAMPAGGTLSFSTDNVVFDESYKKQFSAIVCGTYIVAEIIDTGVGMDEYVKTRLFEPFFTTKDVGKGSGLHLASVHGTIKAHNGYCAVSSQPGHGSAFKIYIPVSLPQSLDAKAPGAQTTEKIHAKILVVDDEELMRSIYSEMLGALGYAVVMCQTGSEAIDLFAKDPAAFDMIIIDMVMNEINGLECFRELKKINPKVCAILASGYDLIEKQHDILSEGFLGILQKPFVSATLLKTVADALRNRTP